MSSPIVVCGAGIVGLASALGLARQRQQVSIVAPRGLRPADPGPAYCPRVYAISPASQRYLAALGVWDVLSPARIAPVSHMRIAGDGGGRVVLDAWQAAQTELAWIVESDAIERALMQAVQLFGIPWIDDRFDRLDDGAIVTLGGQRLAADLFVGADGAHSPLRAAAGLATRSSSYEASALIAHLDAELAHQDTAFQWFIDRGVLALLPLPDSARGAQVSMVWSMPRDEADTLMAQEPAARALSLRVRLLAATQGELGGLTVNSAVHAFSLFVEHSDLIAPGIALVGDAGHRVHPLAGQGLNLGLGDVQALVNAVAARGPRHRAGDPPVLRRYRRARAEPLAVMRLATDGLHHLFHTQATPIAWLRNIGMSALDAMPELKRRLILQASGKS